ncbi:MAG: tRNA (adenosine(37)-N6)-threonylcarbamoyltransferase complex ATPase subunit type 1 TsaE [Pseudomonadota bacterium]|nr:tRNA (adenosine(37)-N6)-threonylcarbamoyltransferase complex ATPase subunit type 1 TsaE [Pseudomonadota bacterium]
MQKARLNSLLKSPEDTADLAAQLASVLQPGDTILLSGDIGAGKTHLARNLIQNCLGYLEDVPSPTFTLVQTYDGPQCEIWHSDLYRLSSPEEVIELGLIDAFEDSICLVEWPDRLQELLPKHALSIELSMTEETGHRNFTAEWSHAKWNDKLKGIKFD